MVRCSHEQPDANDFLSAELMDWSRVLLQCNHIKRGTAELSRRFTEKRGLRLLLSSSWITPSSISVVARRRLAISRNNLLAPNFQFNDTHRKIIFQVMDAYYRLLNSKGQEEAAKANLTNAQTVQAAGRADPGVSGRWPGRPNSWRSHHPVPG